MILQQREDAVGRATKLDAGSFFPVRVPSKWRWTAVLMVAFAALCAYHVSYGPPLLALKEKIMQPRALAQALAPLARMLESAKMELAQAANVLDTDAMKQEPSERSNMGGLQPTANSMRAPSASSNPQNSDDAFPRGELLVRVARRAMESRVVLRKTSLTRMGHRQVRRVR